MKLRQHKNTPFTYSDGSTLRYLGRRRYLPRIFDNDSDDPYESFSFNKANLLSSPKASGLI
jgi:hypothetical protein